MEMDLGGGQSKTGYADVIQQYYVLCKSMSSIEKVSNPVLATENLLNKVVEHMHMKERFT